MSIALTSSACAVRCSIAFLLFSISIISCTSLPVTFSTIGTFTHVSLFALVIGHSIFSVNYSLSFVLFFFSSFPFLLDSRFFLLCDYRKVASNHSFYHHNASLLIVILLIIFIPVFPVLFFFPLSPTCFLQFCILSFGALPFFLIKHSFSSFRLRARTSV